MTDFDPEAPLSRIKGESKKAHSAFMDYFLMGAGRSLRKLLAEFSKQHENASSTKHPPTTKWTTLSKWSHIHRWQARIARQTEIDNETALEQYRQRHMSPAEVVARLSDMGRADMADFADVRTPADLEGKLNSHLVKKVTVQARKNKDGTITAKTTIELHDAKAALDSLARHLGLFEGAGDSEDKPLVIKVLKGVSMSDL
jgi:hypothetical protein